MISCTIPALARLRAITTTVLAFSLWSQATLAKDEDCLARHSACIQSNQQWLVHRPGPFVTIDGGIPRGGGAVSATLGVSYQHEPLTLEAPSPDPEGRSLPLVEHVVDATTLLNFGLSDRLDLGVAFTMVPYEKGLGIDAARSRQPGHLERNALRDPRLDVGYVLWADHGTGVEYLARARGDLSLPLGDAGSFARERGPVLAPGATFLGRWRAFAAGFDTSLRLRQAVTLADVRHGSQWVTHCGVAFDILRQQRLTVSGETSWFWNLASPTQSARRTDLRHLPAEWLFGLASQLTATNTLGLYGGGGLPVSAKKVDVGGGQSERQSFVGLGAPDFRLLLVFVQASALDQ